MLHCIRGYVLQNKQLHKRSEIAPFKKTNELWGLQRMFVPKLQAIEGLQYHLVHSLQLCH